MIFVKNGGLKQKMKINLKKTAVYAMILILIANMVLFALKKISWTLFWTIIIIFAIVAYSGLLKRKR